MGEKILKVCGLLEFVERLKILSDPSIPIDERVLEKLVHKQLATREIRKIKPKKSDSLLTT